jgi:hypothetical protein
LENLLVRDPDDFTRKKIEEATGLIIYPPRYNQGNPQFDDKNEKKCDIIRKKCVIFPPTGNN